MGGKASNPRFLFGMTDRPWAKPGTHTSSHVSQLPDQLKASHMSVSLPLAKNLVYSGPTSGSLEHLQRNVCNVSQWQSNNKKPLFFHGELVIKASVSPTAAPGSMPVSMTKKPIHVVVVLGILLAV